MTPGERPGSNIWLIMFMAINSKIMMHQMEVVIWLIPSGRIKDNFWPCYIGEH